MKKERELIGHLMWWLGVAALFATSRNPTLAETLAGMTTALALCFAGGQVMP